MKNPETFYKPIFQIPHKWDTGWLGEDTSITDIDLAAAGSAGINIYEIKHRSPFLSKCQRELFVQHHLIHIIIAPISSTRIDNGKYHFEALTYEIYCPWALQEFEYVDGRKSWRITNPPQVYITRDEARPIFCGHAPWPCCRRTTFPR
jgi:hypothetical protein